LYVFYVISNRALTNFLEEVLYIHVDVIYGHICTSIGYI